MIEAISQILAEHFKVSEKDVIFISSDIHTDGNIYGFEIRGLDDRTFIYAQVDTEEWRTSEFQVCVPQLGVWIRLWRFPNDPYLPGLSMVGVKAALSELIRKIDSRFDIQTVKNITYRPGKRAVFRVQTNFGYFYVKVTTSSNASRIVKVHDLIGNHIKTAELIGIARDDILFFSELKGEDFLSMANPDYGEISNFLVEAEKSLSFLKTDTTAKRKVVANVDWYLSILKANVTHETFHQISLAVDRLPTVGALRDSTFIHGDFHLGQIKFTPSGIGILDFDNAGMGLVEEDQSTMLASSLFGLAANTNPQVKSRYQLLLQEWLPQVSKVGDIQIIKALAGRHIVAFMASFPKAIQGREEQFLRILQVIGQDDENLLILGSSTFHQPM